MHQIFLCRCPQRLHSEAEKNEELRHMVEELYFDKASEKERWFTANMLSKLPKKWIPDRVSRAPVRTKIYQLFHLLCDPSFWAKIFNAFIVEFCPPSARCCTFAPVQHLKSTNWTAVVNVQQ